MPRRVESNVAQIDLREQYKPHPRQIKAHTATERYVLYGG